MILNLTYYSKENNNKIDAILGEKFNLIKRLKLKGTGSRRMIIENFSSHFIKVKSNFNDIQYANIELRPKGIVVHITKGIENYGWIIPFFRLSIFSSNFFSIHSEGAYINFNKLKSLKENKHFIRKLLLNQLNASSY